MSLTIFPFTIGPLLKNRAGLSEKDLITLMKERKKMIPIWINNMIPNTKAQKKNKSSI